MSKGNLLHYQDLKDEQERQAVVRKGYLPERTVATGAREAVFSQDSILSLVFKLM